MTPRSWAGKCPTPCNVWVPALHQVVQVRCNRWSCPHCGWWKSTVLGRMLWLDAELETPSYALTLTTATPNLPSSTIRDHSARAFRALREYGRCDYFAMVEFTTGRSSTSGGYRRLHLHALLKCGELPASATAATGRAWGLGRVALEPLRTPAGALHYIGAHHAKPAQQPPKGWVGRRIRSSRNYFSMPIPRLRAIASQQLVDEAIDYIRSLN